MPDNAEIERRVVKLLAMIVECGPESFTRESRLDEDLAYDSLDRIEALMAAEDEFGLTISDEDVERFQTVGECVHYIVARGEEIDDA